MRPFSTLLVRKRDKTLWARSHHTRLETFMSTLRHFLLYFIRTGENCVSRTQVPQNQPQRCLKKPIRGSVHKSYSAHSSLQLWSCDLDLTCRIRVEFILTLNRSHERTNNELILWLPCPVRGTQPQINPKYVEVSSSDSEDNNKHVRRPHALTAFNC